MKIADLFRAAGAQYFSLAIRGRCPSLSHFKLSAVNQAQTVRLRGKEKITIDLIRLE